MSDIVERLRLLVPSDSSGAAFDAVTEIVRLRNELHIAKEWSARVIAGQWEDVRQITALRAEVERLRAALRGSYEVYAGSDGFIPATAAEGYQQQIIKQMVDCISAALDGK